MTMNDWFHLSVKKTRNLLQEPGWTLDTELTDKVSAYGGMVYLNSDGRTLENLVLDGGTLFKSRAECIRYIEEFQQACKKAELESSLTYMLPQGKNFVVQVPQLVDELAKQLRFPREELDNSMRSLVKVERIVKRLGCKKCQQPQIFAPLVAYAGEILKQEMDGRWTLRLCDDNKDWEPWIIDSHSNPHPPFILIFKELLEEEYPLSFYSALQREIQEYQAGRKPMWINGRELGWEYAEYY